MDKTKTSSRQTWHPNVRRLYIENILKSPRHWAIIYRGIKNTAAIKSHGHSITFSTLDTKSCSKALKSKQMQISHWLISSLISRGHTYRWGFYCRKIIQLVLTGCIKTWAKESLHFYLALVAPPFFQIAVACVNATNSRRHFKAVGILHWCFCTMETKITLPAGAHSQMKMIVLSWDVTNVFQLSVCPWTTHTFQCSPLL